MLKWIGAFLGALNGGIIGALAGYAIGALIDNLGSGAGSNSGYTSSSGASEYSGHSGYSGYSDHSGYSRSDAAYNEGARNGFLFSLMVLAAHVIQADGKIMHSEMEYVRRFLRQNFGEVAVNEGESILLKLFEYRKQHGTATWNTQIVQACQQMRGVMPEAHRMQLVAFLAEIAKADGNVHASETTLLREIVINLGLDSKVADQMFSLGGNSLEDAYKVLGINSDATDDEVRKAYREQVKKNHPDRVATLGDDVKEAAKKKMQEINDAKERIFKARGM